MKLKRITVLLMTILVLVSLCSCQNTKSNTYRHVKVSMIDNGKLCDGILCEDWDKFVNTFDLIKSPGVENFDLSVYIDKKIFKKNYILFVYREYVVGHKRIEYSNIKISNDNIEFDIKTIPSWVNGAISNATLNSDIRFNYVYDFVKIPKKEFKGEIFEKYNIKLNKMGYDGTYKVENKYPMIRINSYYMDQKYVAKGNTNFNFILIDNYDELKEVFNLQYNLHKDLKSIYDSDYVRFQNIFLIDEYFDSKVFEDNIILYIPVTMIKNDIYGEYALSKEQHFEWIYKDIDIKDDNITITKGYVKNQREFVEIHRYLNDFIIIPRSEFPDMFDFDKEYKGEINNIGLVEDDNSIVTNDNRLD